MTKKKVFTWLFNILIDEQFLTFWMLFLLISLLAISCHSSSTEVLQWIRGHTWYTHIHVLDITKNTRFLCQPLGLHLTLNHQSKPKSIKTIELQLHIKLNSASMQSSFQFIENNLLELRLKFKSITGNKVEVNSTEL